MPANLMPPPEARTVVSDGFVLEIAPDSLKVCKQNAGMIRGLFSYLKTRKTVWALLIVVTVSLTIFKILIAILNLVDALYFSPDWASSLPIVFFLILLYIRSLSANKYFRCDRNMLEVVAEARGKQTITPYSKVQVRRSRYGVVSFGKYSGDNGILFDAETKTVKILCGLRPPEAQMILRELNRLGYDVEWDVGMPMMVEMELERRKRGM